MGVKTVIYTDISRDGGLEGTNMDSLPEAAADREDWKSTASGEESVLNGEITELKDMWLRRRFLGKAIYSGALDLSRAVELAR